MNYSLIHFYVHLWCVVHLVHKSSRFHLQSGRPAVRVNQDTRLNNRVLDIRTPANQAIFHISDELEHVKWISSVVDMF